MESFLLLTLKSTVVFAVAIFAFGFLPVLLYKLWRA